ncbi:MAG: glycosyltransferase family 2 protein [Flavobacteriales bacterium CG_4_9_14_3_um_filter_40_17]|nr:MAG: glycosyltransferase family 2 protein [Flavobacteriales bacterium CG_4_9_14_3_um_filter_40_17]
MPFFSVIIPLYNKEKFIKRTIESVLNQSFGDFELLIINDGSTDRSEAIVQSFSDQRIRYFLKKNEGVSAARNFGINQSKTCYIAFIDADDFWDADFLNQMKQLIESFPDQNVFASAIKLKTPRRVFTARYSIDNKDKLTVVNYFKASMKHTVLSSSSAVFHQKVFKKVGVFDETIKNAEDTDMWIRIGLENKVVFLNMPLATYVLDSQSLSHQSKNYHLLTDFKKFEADEKSNRLLNKFLDYNRFSMAVKQRLIGDNEAFAKTIEKIDVENLSLKRKIILKLPVTVLSLFVLLKNAAAQFGLGNSVFK